MSCFTSNGAKERHCFSLVPIAFKRQSVDSYVAVLPWQRLLPSLLSGSRLWPFDFKKRSVASSRGCNLREC